MARARVEKPRLHMLAEMLILKFATIDVHFYVNRGLKVLMAMYPNDILRYEKDKKSNCNHQSCQYPTIHVVSKSQANGIMDQPRRS